MILLFKLPFDPLAIKKGIKINKFMEFSKRNRKVYLLHQKNQDSSEDLHKVNKEVKGMSDEVFVASSPLLNNHLGVPHDESTEKQESSPQVDLRLKKILIQDLFDIP